MRSLFVSFIASSALALGACSMEDGEVVSASPTAATKTAPDFAAAVSAPGRNAKDVELDGSRQPAAVLAFSGLETGDSVLDIFAGGGYYSEILARAVGSDGKVIAHNAGVFASDDAGKAKWQALKGRNPNLSMIRAGFNEWQPEPASFDFAFSHLVYHDLYFESERFGLPRTDVPAYLAELYTAMKPGGIVAIVDHVGPSGDTRALVEKLHRIDPVTVKADMTAAGFVLEAESDMLANPEDDISMLVFNPAVRGKTNRFMMRFRKPG